ncbi:MAG TPA: SusD/RagB family nutrient-binding outer membrane lipoprotein [Bacteroidales bacterium]|nr:SusD/RagB family nutrient-binding outer membrane lipoprotein [Bacteroidales bacterium]HPJ59108.1 SusD/RagB family nutrient-binding outer membrane lipoprotein [Bacteroidales bacterium]HPR11407.1 SusD/RagB family nutrient-binding outer membrane lipoprotein [Bacteroidales bacterium]HRW85277.1 SusD/RagB family nutrient-binding outer membrane lipoprotein [Bacteroidales bacterium]
MKKIKYILLTAILPLTLLWSCSESIMDEINKNINDPSDMVSSLIISDVMTGTAFSVAGGDFNFYASIYMEHNAGIWGQFYNADIRSSEPTAATTYNNSWVSVYANLYSLKIIIEKCSEGGTEEGNYHTLGIAQILAAYNLAVLTDMMGDVPWTEALQPGVIFTPALDTQQDIYVDIFQFLDDAIVNLGKATIFQSLGAQDFIFGGDADLWMKFAYGLKARYTMRLSLRDPSYADVISFANQSFSSSEEQAQYNYNGTSAKSPFYCLFQDRDYYGASQSLHDKLTERNDPRDDVFFTQHPDAEGDLLFAPNGTANQVQGTYSVSAISTITAPTYLLSYHEIEFLKAEAYVRLNNLALADTALRKAVIAAFEKVNIGLSAAEAKTYFNTYVRPRFTADPLDEVMNQKYIAFYEEEAMEIYNDYRRLMAMGDDVISLSNPANTTKFPLRYSYGNSDVTTNANVRDAYGDGTYVYSEDVWWAGGTR